MRSTVAIAVVLSLALAVTTTPLSAQSPGIPSIVVTTEVLGSIVSRLVDGGAVVTTLMPGGSDPHSWQPSARDSETIFEADLVVANGRGLEEGLLDVIDQAARDGVSVFHATDHITALDDGTAPEGTDDHEGEEHAHEDEEHAHEDEEHAHEGEEHAHEGEEHAHGGGDPHFWLDPLAMRDVVLALAPALSAAGVDVGSRAEALADELVGLDAELALTLSTIPPERRRIVSGHGALGYLAARYDLQIVGTVIPGLSSSDEPSAREVAELVADIRDAGATVLFTDVGTPPSVAKAVADESGARIVELRVAQLPADGDYAELLRSLAGSIAGALTEGAAPN